MVRQATVDESNNIGSPSNTEPHPPRKGRFFGQSVSERREAILKGPLFKVLLTLSLPTLMMAIVQSCIPLFDGLFLNNTAGYIVAGAVGISVNVINMLNALSQGMATAGMAIIGQLNGRGDMAAVREESRQILIFGASIGVILGALLFPLASFVPALADAKAELSSAITTYLQLYSVVIPFVFMAAIFNAIKNATGQPEVTFYRMIILLVLKILFNTLYLVILDMGVVGAALASLSAYILVAIWMVYDLFFKPGEGRLTLKGFHFRRESIGQLLRLGLPTMLSYFMVYVGFFLINREVVQYGEAALNAQTISSNINAMAFIVPSSIATTVTTLVSINIAARQEDRARSSYFKGLILSEILAAVIVALFIPFAPHMVSLFLNHPFEDPAIKATIADIATRSLNIYTLSVVGFAVFMVTQGAVVGLGKTKIPLVMGILRIWLFRYIFILVFRASMGVFSVFWGNLFSNFAAAVVFVIYLLRCDWNSNIISSAREMGDKADNEPVGADGQS